MKQLIIGILLGASLSGTVALAVNPIENLPIQEQVSRVIEAADKQFNTIAMQFQMAQEFFVDIDERLTVIETKLKVKRDE